MSSSLLVTLLFLVLEFNNLAMNCLSSSEKLYSSFHTLSGTLATGTVLPYLESLTPKTVWFPLILWSGVLSVPLFTFSHTKIGSHSFVLPNCSSTDCLIYFYCASSSLVLVWYLSISAWRLTSSSGTL